jgi:hypothetical protein
MINYLENLLYEKTKGKKEEILFTQWQLAKKSIPEILATISNIFPNYTLHDKSHSEAILTNIGRILEKNIFIELPAIDIWLLLCSAFFHDIGMVVFASELNNMLIADEFLSFFRDIQLNKEHPLFMQTQYFTVKDNKICFKDNEVTLDVIESIKYIIAEYIRQKHGKRSKETLENYSIIHLPNNPIPQRLIKTLGNICECHTEPFEKILQLPFTEAGLDYDSCHPRYICCLLRLGDLLDLDNNRVSEIVLKTVKKIPEESFFHLKKHLSISHMRIDSKQIDITANCEDYKTADLTSIWFSWIDNEFTNQMKNWNQIVPKSSYGFLPMVGDLKVNIKNYDTIDGKLYPKFEIDTQKAIELLQGAGFYNEPCQSIRELLQNAVDATLFKIYLENKARGLSLSREKFNQECQKDEYAIKIKIKKGSKDKDKIIWQISISDSGIGMSKEDLAYLCKTGSSSRNKEKQKILSEMPEWMKPSGTFGIGFQSVFLLTDEVHITTRKYNRENIYNIDLFSPTGLDKGAVLIQTEKRDFLLSGTSLSFDFKTKKIPKSFRVSMDQRITNDIIQNYDFVESETFDFEIGEILDEIVQFSKASFIRIILNMDGLERILNTQPSINFSYYSEKTKLALSIPATREARCDIFYRNQYVSKTPLRFNFLHIIVNILAGDAREVLTLNRNELNGKYSKKLENNIISSVCEYIQENFDSFDSQMQIYASMFLNYYGEIIGLNLNKVDQKIVKAWEKYLITINEDSEKQEVTLKNLLQNNNLIKIKYTNHSALNNSYKQEPGFLSIKFSSSRDDEYNFFYCKAPCFFPYISYVGDNEDEFILSKQKELPLIVDNAWEMFLYRYFANNYVSRGIIPCVDKYNNLALKDDYNPPYSYPLGIPSTFTYSKMICPYIIEQKDNHREIKSAISQKLIDTTFEHRKNDSITIEEIQKTYEKFVNELECVISNINIKLKEKRFPFWF